MLQKRGIDCFGLGGGTDTELLPKQGHTAVEEPDRIAPTAELLITDHETPVKFLGKTVSLIDLPFIRQEWASVAQPTGTFVNVRRVSPSVLLIQENGRVKGMAFLIQIRRSGGRRIERRHCGYLIAQSALSLAVFGGHCIVISHIVLKFGYRR